MPITPKNSEELELQSTDEIKAETVAAAEAKTALPHTSSDAASETKTTVENAVELGALGEPAQFAKQFLQSLQVMTASNKAFDSALIPLREKLNGLSTTGNWHDQRLSEELKKFIITRNSVQATDGTVSSNVEQILQTCLQEAGALTTLPTQIAQLLTTLNKRIKQIELESLKRQIRLLAEERKNDEETRLAQLREKKESYHYQVIQLILNNLPEAISKQKLLELQNSPVDPNDRVAPIRIAALYLKKLIDDEQKPAQIEQILFAIDLAVEAMKNGTIVFNPDLNDKVAYQPEEIADAIKAFSQFSTLQHSKSPLVKTFLHAFNYHAKTKDDKIENELENLANWLKDNLSKCGRYPDSAVQNISNFTLPTELAFNWATKSSPLTRDQIAIQFVSQAIASLPGICKTDTPGDFGHALLKGLMAMQQQMRQDEKSTSIDALQLNNKIDDLIAELEYAFDPQGGYKKLALRKMPWAYQVLKVIEDEFKAAYTENDAVGMLALSGLTHRLGSAANNRTTIWDVQLSAISNACFDIQCALQTQTHNGTQTKKNHFVDCLITATAKAQWAIRSDQIGFNVRDLESGKLLKFDEQTYLIIALKELNSISYEEALKAVQDSISKEQRIKEEQRLNDPGGFEPIEEESNQPEIKQSSSSIKTTDEKSAPQKPGFTVGFYESWKPFADQYTKKWDKFTHSSDLRDEVNFITNILDNYISPQKITFTHKMFLRRSDRRILANNIFLAICNYDKKTIYLLEYLLQKCGEIRKGKKAESLEKELLRCLIQTKTHQGLSISQDIKLLIDNLIAKIKIAVEHDHAELQLREKPIIYQVMKFLCDAFIPKSNKLSIYHENYFEAELKSLLGQTGYQTITIKVEDAANLIIRNIKHPHYFTRWHANQNDVSKPPSEGQINKILFDLFAALDANKIGINLPQDEIQHLKNLFQPVVALINPNTFEGRFAQHDRMRKLF